MQELKNKFAQVFIEMLETKTLDQITIKDIVFRCGVSRQSFYYYFEDIYALIEWIFSRAADGILSNHNNVGSWQNGFCSVMHWARQHQKFTTNVYRSIQRDYIENFMESVLSPYMDTAVKEYSAGLTITPDQLQFVSRFFTLSFNAIVLDWVRRGMKEEPEDFVSQLELMLSGDFSQSLRNFHNHNQEASRICSFS